jgi:hypothetical protein
MQIGFLKAFLAVYQELITKATGDRSTVEGLVLDKADNDETLVNTVLYRTVIGYWYVTRCFPVDIQWIPNSSNLIIRNTFISPPDGPIFSLLVGGWRAGRHTPLFVDYEVLVLYEGRRLAPYDLSHPQLN